MRKCLCESVENKLRQKRAPYISIHILIRFNNKTTAIPTAAILPLSKRLVQCYYSLLVYSSHFLWLSTNGFN